MARYPKPDGWQGGSVEGSILRTLDGHLGTNVEVDEGEDCRDRRNERSFDEADLGGSSYDGEAL